MSASVLVVGRRDSALDRILGDMGLRVDLAVDGKTPGRDDYDAVVVLYEGPGSHALLDEAVRRRGTSELVLAAPAAHAAEAQTAGRAVGADVVPLPPDPRRTAEILRRALARRARRERHGDLARRVRALDPDLGREVEILAREDDATSRALDEATRLRSSFIANISHEIRTPVTVLQGMLEILTEDLGDSLADDQLDLIERIRGSGESLVDLLQGLLDLSKAEAGVLETRRERVYFPEVVDELRRQVEPLLVGRPVRLVVDVPRGIEWVTVDATRLRQALACLLSNAAKFTAEGEVRLAARLVGDASEPPRDDPATLLRAPVPAGDTLEVLVSDTGSGISPTDQEIIFEAFRQVDVSTTRRHEGLGIGLTIVREMAKLLGASLQLESQTGTGTRFRLRIPVARGGEAKAPAARAARHGVRARRSTAEPHDLLPELARLFRASVAGRTDAIAWALDLLDRLLQPEAAVFAEPGPHGWTVVESIGRGPEPPPPGDPPPLAPGTLAASRAAQREEGSGWSIAHLRGGGDAATGLVAVRHPNRTEDDAELKILRIVARWLDLELGRDRLTRERGELLAALGRDVKTPLGSLLGYTQTLLRGLRGALAPEQRAVVLRLERALHRVILSTLDLLDLGRAATTGLAGSAGTFPLDRVVRHVLARHTAALELGAHDVRTEIPADLPDCRGDEIRTDRSISNLLRELVDRLSEGSAILVRGASADGFVACEVSAPVSGAAWFVENLAGEPRPEPGEALGLRIARAGIEAQGGRLETEETADGLCIRIRLPAATGS